MSYQSSVIISVSPARAWEVLSDIDHWHEWTPSITSVERLGGESLTVGSKFRIQQPRLKSAIWTVTEVQTGRFFVWESKSPGIRVVAEHEIKPLSQGCKAVLRIKFDGLLGFVARWFLGRLTRRYMELESNGLKERSESMIFTEFD